MRYGLVPDLYGQPAVLHGRLTTLHLAPDGTLTRLGGEDAGSWLGLPGRNAATSAGTRR